MGCQHHLAQSLHPLSHKQRALGLDCIPNCLDEAIRLQADLPAAC